MPPVLCNELSKAVPLRSCLQRVRLVSSRIKPFERACVRRLSKRTRAAIFLGDKEPVQNPEKEKREKKPTENAATERSGQHPEDNRPAHLATDESPGNAPEVGEMRIADHAGVAAARRDVKNASYRPVSSFLCVFFFSARKCASTLLPM